MNALAQARYADPWELLFTAVDQVYRTAELVSVADHAARRRWLNNAGGGYVGRWSHDQAPYLVEPMQVLNSDLHLTTALVGPGQCGKSEVALNWLLHAVEADPTNMLWYSATGPLVESWVKTRVNPMLRDHHGLAAALGGMPGDDTLAFKRFSRMYVEFLAATASTMISKSAARIVADEFDRYDKSLGDVHHLLDVRRQSFGAASMILAISHPDRATGLDPARDWLAGIMALYGASDRRTWWAPCPGCGAVSCFAPTGSRAFTLHYPADAPLEEIAAATRLLCPVNGCLIEDWQRRGMNAAGVWVGSGQDIDEAGIITGELAPRPIAGFWITGIMSPFLLGGIGGLAAGLVRAERAAETAGDETALREYWSKSLGIPYQAKRRIGSVDAQTLAERADPSLALGLVPDFVRFLTASIDVQADRFEVLVRGWGVRGVSVIIDYQVHPALPAIDPDAWDRLLAVLFAARYALAGDPSQGMTIKAIGYDSGGEAGVTTQAYDAWLRFKALPGVVRKAGRINGRDAWNLLPLKGRGEDRAARLAVVYPDSARKDRAGGARGQVPLGNFGANAFKDDLGGQLARAELGPWFVHIPAELRGNWGAVTGRTFEAPHKVLEQLVAERRDARGRWSAPKGVRNELTDLMAMSHVMAHLHGLARITWDRPPGWAAEAAQNPLVGPLDTPPPAGLAQLQSRAALTASQVGGGQSVPSAGVPAPLAVPAVVPISAAQRLRAAALARMRRT